MVNGGRVVLLALIPWTPKPDPLLPKTPVPEPAPSESRLTLAGGTLRFMRSLVLATLAPTTPMRCPNAVPSTPN